MVSLLPRIRKDKTRRKRLVRVVLPTRHPGMEPSYEYLLTGKSPDEKYWKRLGIDEYENPRLAPSDVSFIKNVLLPRLGVKSVRMCYSHSKAKHPDIWVQVNPVPVITVTDEFLRQSPGERRKRLTHEFLHLKGLNHGKVRMAGKVLDYSTYPKHDSLSRAVYKGLVANPLSEDEKQEMNELYKVQLDISKKHKEHPARRAFWMGRALSTKLTSKTYNPDDIKLIQDKADKAAQSTIRNIKSILAGYNVYVVNIEHRIKTRESIIEKMERRGKTLPELRDIAGVRVIVLAHDFWKTIDLLTRKLATVSYDDYVTKPGPKGYFGYHLDIVQDSFPVEVQIHVPISQRTAVLSHILLYKPKYANGRSTELEALQRRVALHRDILTEQKRVE